MKILRFEFIAPKKRLLLEVNEKLTQADTTKLIEGLSGYKQLTNIKLNLIDQFEMSEDFILSFTKFMSF